MVWPSTLQDGGPGQGPALQHRLLKLTYEVAEHNLRMMAKRLVVLDPVNRDYRQAKDKRVAPNKRLLEKLCNANPWGVAAALAVQVAWPLPDLHALVCWNWLHPALLCAEDVCSKN